MDMSDCVNFCSMGPATRCVVLAGSSVIFQIAIACGAEPSVISSSNLARLAAEVWKELPVSADVTVYRERRLPPPSLASVRKNVKRIYSLIEEQLPVDATPSSDELRENLEAEVQRVYRVQEEPRYLKQRIRISGRLYRVDQTIAKEGQAVDATTPYEGTYVNGGSPEEGSPDRFCYYHNLKHAVRDDKRKWKPEPILEALSVGKEARNVFKLLLGEVVESANGEKFLVPSSEKMAEICNDANSRVQIVTSQEDQGKRSCLRIEVKSRADGGATVAAVLVDRDNFARAYRIELMYPTTGKTRYIEERSEFDEGLGGFPRVWVRRSFSPDGEETYDHYVVSEAKIGDRIPQEVFEFSPPEGYVVYDGRPDVPVVTGLPAQPRYEPPSELRHGEWNLYLIGANVLVILILLLLVVIKRCALT